MYFRGAEAAILVFSLTDQKSFNSLNEWVDLLHRAEPDCEIALVGNKADLPGSRVVQFQSGDAKSSEIGAIFYIETSAVTGQGVTEIFEKFLESPKFTPVVDEAFEGQGTANPGVAISPPHEERKGFLGFLKC
jgi:GTPase SAR1 family protein